jgi:Ni2+-binding GTPase involved in maturation of urease and hydrogenase
MLQDAANIVGECHEDVTIVQQRDSAIHRVELVGHELDLAVGESAGDQSVSNESRDLARLAASAVVVFLDDHVVQSGGEAPKLTDVFVAAIPGRRDHTDASPGIDA